VPNPVAVTVKAHDWPCKHRWEISTAQGEYSEGTCARCGERKRFRNVFEEKTYWRRKVE
jgi:hypothetical protein